MNDSYRAVNRLLAGGASVKRADKPTGAVRAGDFLVTAAPEALAASVAAATGVDFAPLSAVPAEGTHDVPKPRIECTSAIWAATWTRVDAAVARAVRLPVYHAARRRD